jgi:hypothetical protein
MTIEPYEPQMPEIAGLFLDHYSRSRPHDGTAWARDPDYDGPCEAIAPTQVDELAHALLDFVANVVASVIDAGSERDAVNENEELLLALTNELKGWTVDG